ncbi:ATP-binding protein [Pseudofulvibacter geojedonensis]|uniref:ATP-binding protein n=1 Tax=Pseudofulvibacter geojedonensis TaxID=1123758 RepID=A0ABW3I040_9FLAO
MINKRLLIKKLLTYNDENSFYDKKRQLNLHSKEGKAKFLKHICALSNANPANNSYIVVGVEDGDNKLTGVDFFDDSKIQNLINAYLRNPPSILYENIPFPSLPKNKVLGLVTVKAKTSWQKSFFKKSILKYYSGYIYKRIGSNSSLMEEDFDLEDRNSTIVFEIEKSAKNNIEHTLDSVISFREKHQNRDTHYKVFKEQFVVCWSGRKKETSEGIFYSRVDIEMVTEQVKLFYSALDEVAIHYNENSFIIVEYVTLGINNNLKRYPLEKRIIHFSENGNYNIANELIFEPPQYDKKALHHIYNANAALINKLKNKLSLTENEKIDVLNLPSTSLILKLNDFTDAKQKLIEAKTYIKRYSEELYQEYKEVIRILRKIKYH